MHFTSEMPRLHKEGPETVLSIFFDVKNQFFRNIHFAFMRAALIAAVLLLSAPMARAAGDYAANSVLAEGRWKKVKVASTGMQFISTASLRSMGFPDPAKVNVYGFGGRAIPEKFTDLDPDDLPILPIVRTSRGIYFFGFDHIRWNRAGDSGNLAYSHVMQPYAEESYYFLSDRDAQDYQMPQAPAAALASAEPLTVFTQMLLHEQDLVHPSTSGRVYLGEDFRSPTRRSFPFTLTDLADGTSARVKVAFASKTSGSASFKVAANSVQLAANTTDNLPAVTSADQFMTSRTSVKNIANPREDLSIDITFKNSGTVSLARLDYIEVEYQRQLIMRDGQLHFNINSTSNAAVTIDGAEESTLIWDITDPVRPSRVDFTLSGSKAVFGATGQREYIAFTPDKCGTAITSGENVDCQNLHALPIPDMLIISPREYLDASERLAAHHRSHDGLKVHVLTPEQIYNEFSSGTPDVSAFRKILKMWYIRGQRLASEGSSVADSESDGENGSDAPDSNDENGEIRYCLIMSRPTYDNKMLMSVTQKAGAPRVPIWQSPTGNSKNTSYSTDDYIGMLDETRTSSFAIGSAKLRVSVGRMPVLSAAQASEMVDKYINYVTSTDFGAWRNQLLFIGDDQDSGVHFRQSEDAYKKIIATERGNNFQIERLYLDTYTMEAGASGYTYPEAKSRMLRLWNDGVSYINYIGHAYHTGWGHESLLTITDIEAFRNKRLPFVYAATCEFARYDDDSRSGAELLWANTEGGIIATICPSRTVFITQNGFLTNHVAENLFKTETPGMGRRIGDIFIDAKNSISGTDDNKLRYVIIGNPAMRMPLPKYQVEINTINDIDPDEAEEFPTLQARGKAELAGRILREDGSPADDFNGTIDIVLLDAEKVIQTNGNGQDGTVEYYNDRKTQLYHGMARVSGGEWKTTVLLPSEIENNYTPARFTFYAYSDAGIEAHGQTSKLYVYGYNKDAGDDIEGPEIKYFALNRQDFQNGGVVHSSPVVLASVSDPSGINLSDAGIGHKITLTLDGNRHFEDVNSYYTPDPDDATAGSLMYPLSDIEAGKHTITLTVWDNANNSSAETLDFEVAVAKAPEIFDLFTDVNPAREKVNFTLSTDRPMARLDCRIEVFDLNGRRVWSSEENASTDIQAAISKTWDLKDASGVRVPRGIYLYRATITTENGTSTTKTQRLAVTAQ